MDLNILIGGPQGGGVETAGLLAVRTFAMQGLEVFADREYHSNIKGKHSYSHIRTSDGTIKSINYPVDALGALDAETLATHYQEVKKGGFIVHDAALAGKLLTKIPSMDPLRMERLKETLSEKGIGETVGNLDLWLESHGMKVVAIPFGRILAEILKYPNPLIERAMNTAVTSALLHSIGVMKEAISGAASFLFREKKGALELNLKTVDTVCEVAKPFVSGEAIKPRKVNGKRLLVAGNDAVAIGKILGGLRLQTYYPITPAADESFTLEQNNEIKNSEGEIVGSPIIIQAEDEISAIGMAIGGALAGVRSATSTSGPGFSLMVEGLGWAGNSEVPIVVTLYQRGGPSTGLPTRHSQSDLLFSLFAGHGEFCRIVLASGDHFEATLDAIKCMNYAEVYQIPVVHLLDKGVANCVTTTTATFDYSINRGKRLNINETETYKRFKFTEDNISPRAFLGERMMWYTGDEHNELGHICEDPINRNAMYKKRLDKSKMILSEAPDGDKAVFYGPDRYDDLILTWGITTGAVVDALDTLNGEGRRRIAVLQVRMMDPFPNDYLSRFISEAGQVIDIEANYLGQLAELAEARCHTKIPSRVLKYTGRLITEDEVASSYVRILKGEERIVLSGGE